MANFVGSSPTAAKADFWAVSAEEDSSKTKILEENGMTVSAADDTLTAKMAEAGKAMWDAFYADVPDAKAIVEAYTAKVGK